MIVSLTVCFSSIMMTNLTSVWSIITETLQRACHLPTSRVESLQEAQIQNMSLKTISKSKGAPPSKERTQESKTRNIHRRHDKLYTLWRLIRVRHRSETAHRWTQSGDDRQEARLTHKRKRLKHRYDCKHFTKHHHGHETWTWDTDMRHGQGREGQTEALILINIMTGENWNIENEKTENQMNTKSQP